MRTQVRALPAPLGDLCDALSVPHGLFVLDPATGERLTSGYVVALRGHVSRFTGRVYPDDVSSFAYRQARELTRAGRVLLGFRVGRGGMVSLTVAMVTHSLKTARRLAREDDQRTFVDLDRNAQLPV
jgi:hypothetical protein